VTKPDFLSLFVAGTPLQQAAAEWWDVVASSGHPKSRLWFRHWCEETRALPAIARAFEEAARLGLDKAGGARGYLACEVFERLHEACRDGRCSSHLLGICAGPPVGNPEADADAVTFLNARLAPDAPDVQVEQNVRQQLAASRGTTPQTFASFGTDWGWPTGRATGSRWLSSGTWMWREARASRRCAMADGHSGGRRPLARGGARRSTLPAESRGSQRG